MPRILPTRYFPESINSDGEQEILDRLIGDSTINDWWVLHSYHIADHIVQKEGEVDFLVFVPGKGIITIEVKGHRQIKYKDGNWFFNKNLEPERKGPFTQAKENMWSLIELIQNHDKKPVGFSSIIWTHICIFPFATFDYVSSEWSSWQIIDAEKLNKKPLSFLIQEAIDSQIKIESKDSLPSKLINSASSDLERSRYKNVRKNFNNNNLDRKMIEHLIKILRPNMESITESPQQRVERINKEIDAFTPEQETLLESIKGNKNFLVTGPAGSGKTLLATEICNIFAKQGKKVLYLCHNKGLKLYLNNKFKNKNFDIKTFFGLLSEITNSNSDNELNYSLESDYFFDLCNRAMDVLLNSNDKYDVIVIDEFQDLAIEEYMYLIDRLLSGGFSSGYWYLFGDFERQNLFKRNKSSSEVMRQLGYQHFELPLRRNCRNTELVAEQIEALVKLDPPYKRPFIRKHSIAEPIPYPYKDNEQQIENLIESIEGLVALDYSLDEILVLSPLSKNSAANIANSKQNVIEFSEYDYTKNIQETKGPYFSTIYKHKGLEFNIVILTDIEAHQQFTNKDEELTSLLYTGLTRSLETFILHIEKNLYNSGLFYEF